MTHDLKMPGDYEYRALHHGNKIQKQWNRNRIVLIRNTGFISKKDTVLDAGCGSGNVLIAFSGKAKQIEGWDINPNSIKFLKGLIVKKKLNNANTYVKNLLNVDGEPKFSKVILTEVIEHFAHEDYVKMLRNINSVMVKGGEIFITTPNDKSTWPLLDFSLKIFQKYFQHIPTFEDRHLGHFDKNKLKKDVEKAGFKVIKLGTMNSFSPFLTFLPQKHRDKVCAWESKHFPFGPLIYVIAEKK